VNQFFYWLDKYTEGLQAFVQAHIILAPLLLLLVEEMGIPLIIPGDAIVGYVGYGLNKHHSVTFIEAFILALMAVLVGSSILFFISKKWGKQVINKFGKYIFVKQRHIDNMEKQFKKYGIWTVIFGRHIPGMRIPITIFAASSGMKYLTFIGCTFLSTVLWIIFYLKVGSAFGSDIQSLFRKDAVITILVVVSIILVSLSLHFVGTRKILDKK